MPLNMPQLDDPTTAAASATEGSPEWDALQSAFGKKKGKSPFDPRSIPTQAWEGLKNLWSSGGASPYSDADTARNADSGVMTVAPTVGGAGAGLGAGVAAALRKSMLAAGASEEAITAALTAAEGAGTAGKSFLNAKNIGLMALFAGLPFIIKQWKGAVEDGRSVIQPMVGGGEYETTPERLKRKDFEFQQKAIAAQNDQAAVLNKQALDYQGSQLAEERKWKLLQSMLDDSNASRGAMTNMAIQGMERYNQATGNGMMALQQILNQ